MGAELARTRIAFDGSDTGTGKTFTTCFVLKQLADAARAAGKKLPVLVICPKSVLRSWADTLAAFQIPATVTNYEMAWREYGEVVPIGPYIFQNRGESMTDADAAKARWQKGELEMEKRGRLRDKFTGELLPDVKWRSARSYFQFMGRWSVIVFDEVHRCGGMSTINSKMLIAAKRANMKLGTRVIALSATAADTPMRLKGLGFLLDLFPLNDYMTWLVKCGAKPSPFGGMKWNANDHRDVLRFIHEQIYERGGRMRISTIADFPKFIRDVRIVPAEDKNILKLSGEMQSFYNEKTVAAHQTEHEMAKITFLRQSMEIAKVPSLVDMIEDEMETAKVVVFFNFKATRDELVTEALKHKWTHGVIDGDTPDVERECMKVDFQANKIDVLFVNNQAGGVGLSLHDPDTQYPRASLHLPSFSSLLLVQSLGRTVRANGGFSRQHLVYLDTPFEQRIARAVRSKLDNVALLNDNELCGDFRLT